MECTVERVTVFNQDNVDNSDREVRGVAAVMLAVGPVQVRARLMQRETDERLFLSMPGKKIKDDQWFDHVKFLDHTVFKQLESQAVELYTRSSARSN